MEETVSALKLWRERVALGVGGAEGFFPQHPKYLKTEVLELQTPVSRGFKPKSSRI